jgi:ABC-type lipoprotein export system ATPase subunit
VSSDTIVACSGLSKTYVTSTGGIEALHSVDAAFAAGQLTAIVGASGSGKSTLLRAIAGLDRPTSGSILAGGRELSGASSSELRRHRAETVTYVSQKPADNFIPHLTLAGHATDEPEIARKLLADVDLAHRLDSLPVELSGGEQARAAFALALGRGTKLVVVDEPTAELDDESCSTRSAARPQWASRSSLRRTTPT